MPQSALKSFCREDLVGWMPDIRASSALVATLVNVAKVRMLGLTVLGFLSSHGTMR